MIKVVEISKDALKDLRKAPISIKKKLFTWVASVEERGLVEVRKVSSYKDEALKGDRKGQRSIRLNIQWRAIYELKNDKVQFILIQEITPHDY